MSYLHDVDIGEECVICSCEKLSVIIPSFANNLSRAARQTLSLSISLHEKPQLIFNKYRYEYHFRRKMTSRRLRDVPRSAYSKRPEASRQGLIVACNSPAQEPIQFAWNRWSRTARTGDRYASTPSRNNLSRYSPTSFLPHSSISRHLHTILAFLQRRFLIYELSERKYYAAWHNVRIIDTNIICIL